MDEEVKAIEDYLNDKARQFDQLTVERHKAGEKEYGAATFLENDVIRMMLEELADTANYCRMQGIKLLMLQDQLEAELGEQMGAGNVNDQEGQDLQIGFQSFKGTKDIGWGRE